MNKTITKTIAFILTGILLLALLSSCTKPGLSGEYSGNDGSYLQLNKDGTCLYSYRGSKTGTWEVKKHTLYVDFGSYHLYADLKQSQKGFLLKGNNYWIDEFFTKM